MASCGQSQGKKHDDQNKTGIDVCKLSKEPSAYIASIVHKKAKEVVASIKEKPNAEECILNLIDKLTQGDTMKTENLSALESLNAKSDGFLSEYFMEVSLELLDNSDSGFIDFLRKGKGGELEKSLIDGLGMELSMEEMEIESFLETKIPYNISEEDKEYLLKIMRKVDATKFE